MQFPRCPRVWRPPLAALRSTCALHPDPRSRLGRRRRVQHPVVSQGACMLDTSNTVVAPRTPRDPPPPPHTHTHHPSSCCSLVVAMETALEDGRYDEAARLRDEFKALRKAQQLSSSPSEVSPDHL